VFILKNKKGVIIMERKKYLMLILGLLVIGQHRLMAQQQVSVEEARKAALHTLNIKHSDKGVSSEANIKAVNQLDEDKHTLMYEVILESNQGVLLSGNKACLPVLGYYETSENQSIFSDDVPDGLKDMLENYKRQIMLCFTNDTIQLYYQKEWQQLQETKFTGGTTNGNRVVSSITATEIVSPLLTSKWGQSYSNQKSSYPYISIDCNAYNYYVDESDSDCGCSVGGHNCPAGCTAVAMAQVMYYWKYPVYLNNKSEQYDWCNMPDLLFMTSPNYSKERHAVARLMKDAGVAAGMSYCYFGTCSSMAELWEAREALEDDFDYSTNAHVDWRWTHTTNAWKNKIKAELNNGRPVMYCAMDGINGHTFVCDGYDSDDFFHFNWGWRGDYDDWFTIDNLSPGGSTYSSAEHALFELYPNNPLRDYCTYYIPLWQHYHNYYIQHGQTTPAPYFNVPKTFPYLESVDESIAQTLGLPSSWYTIPTGATAEYVSHEVIVLRPGFHAQAGSNFTARIEPCIDCSSSPMSTKPITNEEMNVANQSSQVENVEKSFIGNEPWLGQNVPNPVRGIFSISYYIPSVVVNAKILISDLTGSIVSDISLQERGSGKIFIETSVLQKGIYIYSLILDGKVSGMKKIIVL
jgi:hypothetical protein